eukprot:6179045-Pleurochrysis_carterae.AAC.5
MQLAGLRALISCVILTSIICASAILRVHQHSVFETSDLRSYHAWCTGGVRMHDNSTRVATARQVV